MDWRKYQKALNLVVERFGDKKYGQLPYLHHLLACERQLSIYCMHPMTPEILRKLPLEACNELLQAVILHDILEDTETAKHELVDGFGERVADLVDAVTNPPHPPEGKLPRDEIFKVVYPKIRATENAIIVKLCDRIANFESCVTHRLSKDRPKLRRKFIMYVSEHPSFKRELQSAGNFKMLRRMWEHLDNLAEMGGIE